MYTFFECIQLIVIELDPRINSSEQYWFGSVYKFRKCVQHVLTTYVCPPNPEVLIRLQIHSTRRSLSLYNGVYCTRRRARDDRLLNARNTFLIDLNMSAQCFVYQVSSERNMESTAQAHMCCAAFIYFYQWLLNPDGKGGECSMSVCGLAQP